jgi:esterase/lipase superfamily enzyme
MNCANCSKELKKDMELTIFQWTGAIVCCFDCAVEYAFEYLENRAISFDEIKEE